MKNIILFALIFHSALCAAQLTSAGITVTQENQGFTLTPGSTSGVFEYHHPTIPVDQKTTYTSITPSAKPIFKELLLEYEAYCNELVPDTITEFGEVNPIRGGKLDTIWKGYKCREFKHGNRLSFQDCFSGGWQIVDCMGNVLEESQGPVYVGRLHICAVKRRELEPWGEHFWNWLKN